MTHPDERPTFEELLKAASEAAQEEFGPYEEQDLPGPGDHAWLDQFLAEHRDVPPPSDEEFLGRIGVTDGDDR